MESVDEFICAIEIIMVWGFVGIDESFFFDAEAKKISGCPKTKTVRMSNSLPIYIELDESDINYDSEKQTVLIIFAAFAGILIIYFAVRLLLPLVSKQTEEMRLKDELDTKRNAESFVTNFHSIMGHFFGPSVSLKDIRRSPSKLIPHSFILVWVVSIIVIDNAIRSFDPATGSPIIKQPQTQCGLILFFISVLGYMLNRTYSYYKGIRSLLHYKTNAISDFFFFDQSELTRRRRCSIRR